MGPEVRAGGYWRCSVGRSVETFRQDYRRIYPPGEKRAEVPGRLYKIGTCFGAEGSGT